MIMICTYAEINAELAITITTLSDMDPCVGLPILAHGSTSLRIIFNLCTLNCAQRRYLHTTVHSFHLQSTSIGFSRYMIILTRGYADFKDIVVSLSSSGNVQGLVLMVFIFTLTKACLNVLVYTSKATNRQLYCCMFIGCAQT